MLLWSFSVYLDFLGDLLSLSRLCAVLKLACVIYQQSTWVFWEMLLCSAIFTMDQPDKNTYPTTFWA